MLSFQCYTWRIRTCRGITQDHTVPLSLIKGGGYCKGGWRACRSDGDARAGKERADIKGTLQGKQEQTWGRRDLRLCHGFMPPWNLSLVGLVGQAWSCISLHGNGEVRHLFPLAFWVGGSYQKLHNHHRHTHFSPKGKWGPSRKGNGYYRTKISPTCSSSSRGNLEAWVHRLPVILRTTIPDTL